LGFSISISIWASRIEIETETEVQRPKKKCQGNWGRVLPEEQCKHGRNCCQVTGLIKEVSLLVYGVSDVGLLLSSIMDYIRMQEAAEGSRCTCLFWAKQGDKHLYTLVGSVVLGPCFHLCPTEAPEILFRLIMAFGWTFSPGRPFDL